MMNDNIHSFAIVTRRSSLYSYQTSLPHLAPGQLCSNIILSHHHPKRRPLQLRLRFLHLHHSISHNPSLNLSSSSLGHIIRKVNLQETCQLSYAAKVKASKPSRKFHLIQPQLSRMIQIIDPHPTTQRYFKCHCQEGKIQTKNFKCHQPFWEP